MLKHKMSKAAAVILAVLFLSAFASCTPKPPIQEQSKEESQCESAAESREESETESKISGESKNESQNPAGSSIAKVQVTADNGGIYATVITLKSGAADKGVIEMTYRGTKGSAQEDVIVNTFRIEYAKSEDGTYEIRTFYDGEVYQNQHKKSEVKVVNEYSAAFRTGDITVTYTPDGGEPQQIFYGVADDYKS